MFSSTSDNTVEIEVRVGTKTAVGVRLIRAYASARIMPKPGIVAPPTGTVNYASHCLIQARSAPNRMLGIWYS